MDTTQLVKPEDTQVLSNSPDSILTPGDLLPVLFCGAGSKEIYRPRAQNSRIKTGLRSPTSRHRVAYSRVNSSLAASGSTLAEGPAGTRISAEITSRASIIGRLKTSVDPKQKQDQQDDRADGANWVITPLFLLCGQIGRLPTSAMRTNIGRIIITIMALPFHSCPSLPPIGPKGELNSYGYEHCPTFFHCQDK